MKIINLANIKSIFLDNKTTKQTVFKNTFWLTAGLGVNRLLKLVLFVYAARILGAVEYGRFNFALAFISIFSVFSEFGISTIMTREFSREEKREDFNSIMSLKILLSLATLLIIILSSFFVTSDSEVRKLISILIFFNLINGFLNVLYAIFMARQKMEYQAWGEILQNFLATALGLLLLFKLPSAESLSYAFLISSAIGLFFVVILFNSKIFKIGISWNKSIWSKYLLLSWPVALTSLFDSLYNHTDSVMMGHWGMIAETGWYNAAFRLTWTTYLFVGLVGTSFYPILSKLFTQSKEELQRTWNYLMEIMIIFSIPIMVGGIFLAPRIIDSFYGTSYEPSILTFQILIVMVGILLLYGPFYGAMLVFNRQKEIFWIIFGGAITNIVLNLILIPKYTLYGASMATAISHFLVFSLLLIYTLKLTTIRLALDRFLGILGESIFSVAIMFLLLFFMQKTSLSIIFLVIVGVIAYFASFFASNFIFKKSLLLGNNNLINK